MAHSNSVFKWITIVPLMIVLAILVVYPLVDLILRSTRDYGSTLTKYDYVGLQWYDELLTDSRANAALQRTVVYSVASVVGSITIGMALALALEGDFPGARIIRTLLFCPYATMLVASALLWKMMLRPSNGIVNHLLDSVGLPTGTWLNNVDTVLPTLVIIQIWRSTPFAMLVLIAGLRSLPEDVYEAAKIDGASNWQQFRYLTLSLLRSIIITVILFLLIDTLKQFPLIWVLTEGGPLRSSETLYIYGYQMAFKFFDIGYGSAILTVLLGIIMLVSVFWMSVRTRSWI